MLEQHSELWRYLLTTVATFLGSSLAAAIVGAFLARRFNKELEAQRAALTRATSVHVLQVKAVNDMYTALTTLKSAVRSWSSSARDTNNELGDVTKDVDTR